MNYSSEYQGNYFQILKDISKNEFAKIPIFANIKEDMIETISDKYNLSKGQVLALAYVVHRQPIRVTADSIIKAVDSTFDEAALTDLQQRMFLIKAINSQGEERYFISNECYYAMNNGEDIDLNPKTNCMEELKKISTDFAPSPDWLKDFNTMLHCPENAKMLEAVNALGIMKLGEDAQSVFWLLAAHFVSKFSKTLRISDSSSKSSVSGVGKLVKAGLVVSVNIMEAEYETTTDNYALSPTTVRALFHGCDDLVKYDEITCTANVTPVNEITEVKLFFTEKSQEEVNNLRTMLMEEGYRHVVDTLTRKKRNPAIVSLFWGPPGTGKTEVIKQLALESGRDLIFVDISKTNASKWGEAEKNFRSLFRAYSYIEAVSTKAPILVLNECDQFLCKRLTNIDHAIDRSENAVSSILLESLENFRGIMLATTNLPTNLDEAFERRILFKTQLTAPDARARKEIWKEQIPELTDGEAKNLADFFEMTGAQIRNIVMKRDLAELYYKGDRGFDYIAGLCKTELAGVIQQQKRYRPTIGFCVSNDTNA